MTNQQVFFQNISVLTVVIGIVLNIVLINAYGIQGAALSTLATMIIWNLSCVLYVKHTLGIVTVYLPQRYRRLSH